MEAQRYKGTKTHRHRCTKVQKHKGTKAKRCIGGFSHSIARLAWHFKVVMVLQAWRSSTTVVQP